MFGISNRWRLWLILGVLLVIFIPAAAASAQEDQNQQCLQCHGNENFAAEHNGEKISLYVNNETFQSSIHGDNSCTTCHTGEKQFPHQNTVFGKELQQKVIEKSCNTCHAEIGQKYANGMHAAQGPNCLDCHGSGHQINKVETVDMLSSSKVIETCTGCHQGEVKASYEESFHGKAISLGSTKAPTCIDCHDAHEVLGPDNPASTVAAENVAETCAKCHGVAASGFAQGMEHFELSATAEGKPMYYTFKFFTWLTIITISLLIIHIELELFRKLKGN